jgi:GNAT superfamily N-acetyltransferase
MTFVSSTSGPAVATSDKMIGLEQAYDAIAWLESEYPGFCDWYWDRVVPGLAKGERRLTAVERGDRVVGVGISKRTSSERKMCTIWVDADFEGSGLGVRLMRDSMRWLGTDKPLATVSQSRMPGFAKIMAGLGYELTQVLPDYYVQGQSEFVFNGALQVDA